jgi:tRNA dimethylallyltransferase
MASIRDGLEPSAAAASSPGADTQGLPEPPIILIAGPTGVGKSTLALGLARALGGEIISADSRQVYRGMEIGTAQPTAEELAAVPHHLVGVIAPDQHFSVAEFVDLAERALHAIAARSRPAFVVGGTYHYVQALLDGLTLPRVPPRWAMRRELEQLAGRRGPGELHARLVRLDPAAAASIPSANVRRVIRALEVIEATGQPFSELGRRRGQARAALRLALTMPRAELYARVDARIEDMLRRGWLDEIRALLAAGYGADLPALSSTGYRELAGYLRGELALDEAVRRVKYSTHAYIRRQYAWLRRDPRLEWLEHGPDLFDRALARAQAYLRVHAGGQRSGTAVGLPAGDKPAPAAAGCRCQDE